MGCVCRVAGQLLYVREATHVAEERWPRGHFPWRQRVSGATLIVVGIWKLMQTVVC